MLSIVGRAAVRGLASKPIVTSSVVSRLASRAAADENSLGWLVSSFVRSCALRSFATQAEVTKTTKTTTRKRATTTAGAKPKKAVAKPAKKPKKVVKKKKKVVKKATRAVGQKKKKKPKRKPTPEERDKLQLKELKKTSLYLEEPKNAAPAKAYLVFMQQHIKGQKFGTRAGTFDRYKELGAEWKNLPSSEAAQFKRAAEENKLNNAALHKAWIERHTPAQIRDANLARHLLKRKFNYPKLKRLIKDDRQPSGPLQAYTYYTKARWASGDFANMGVVEAAKLVGAEWKGLSDSEKEPYLELAKADQQRHHKEYQAVIS
ncbi:HMG box protein [Seiridium cupressi]